MEECLDYDPAVRPPIATVCERIQVSKDVYVKEFPQGVITLYQQVQELKVENEKLTSDNEEKDATIQQMINQMVIYYITNCKYNLILYCFLSPPQGVYQHNK